MQDKAWLHKLPPLTAGLFAGRVVCEIVGQWWPLGWLTAVFLTLLTTATALTLLRRQTIAQSWPLLLLLLYVFSPEVNPTLALTAVLLTTLTQFPIPNSQFLIHNWSKLLPLAAFLVYLHTLTPDILPADNGEFQLVATNLGVAHPPGFPLYTLLGHLFTQLPLGATPAWRLNLFAAVTSTLTLWLVQASVYRLTKSVVGGLTAVIALATATTFWAQATTANVRSLTALFAALAIYWLIQFQEDQSQSENIKDFADSTDLSAFVRVRPRPISPTLPLAALSLSLGITHHASLAFMGIVWVIFVFAIDPSLLRQPRRWVSPIAAGLVGLLPLLYLPLRGLAVQNGADIRGATAGLASWDGFWNHALALGFRGDLFYFITPADLWARAQVMGNVLTFQFSPWLLAGMAGGLGLLLWRRQWAIAWLLGGAFLVHTFITATYRAPQTVEYMLPAYVPLVLLLGYAVGEVGKNFTAKDAEIAKKKKNFASFAPSAVQKLFIAGMLTAVFHQTLAHYPSFATLSRDYDTRQVAETLLLNAPEGSTILAHWHWATPLWYLQEVEGVRPDAAVQFVFPTSEPYAATWARRVQEELAHGRSVITTHFDEGSYAQLPPPEPLGDAFLFRQTPRTTLPNGFSALNQPLGNDVELVGYQLPPLGEIAEETILTLAWQAVSPDPVAMYAHLVDENGRLQAQDDRTLTPQPNGITLTQFRLTPRYGAAPGGYAIFVGLSGDETTRTAVAQLTVTAMSQPPITLHPLFRTALVERPLQRLIGYDWDNTLPDQPRLYLHWQTEQGYQTELRDNPDLSNLPSFVGAWGVVSNRYSVISNRYPVRQLITDYCSLITNNCSLITNSHYIPLGNGIFWTNAPIPNLRSPALTFRSRQPINRDYVVSVRLIGYEPDGFHWAWWDLDDSIPALGGIPTLKWITGSRVTSRHTLTPSDAATDGQKMGVTLGLYDAFTNRPLPVLDERMLEFTGIPLGETTYKH